MVVPGLWCVIPTVHRVDSVKKTIYSIEGGSYVPEGLVVVDNHPGDACGFAPTNSVAASMSMMTVREYEYLGSGGGFRAGIQRAVQAGAKFVLLLDDDCTLAAGAIEALMRNVNSSSAAMFSANTNERGDGWGTISGWVRWIQPITDTPSSHAVLVPWSGMLLDINRVQWDPLIGSVSRRYWFTWDDYAFCELAQREGATIHLVQDAVIHSVRDTANYATWKGCYEARNGILFSSASLQSWRRWRFHFLFILRYVLVGGIRNGSLVTRLKGAVLGLIGQTGQRWLPKY